MEPQEKPKRKFDIKSFLIFLLVVLVAALLVAGYSAYQTITKNVNELTQQISDKDSQITLLTSENLKYQNNSSELSKLDPKKLNEMILTSKILPDITLSAYTTSDTVGTFIVTLTKDKEPLLSSLEDTQTWRMFHPYIRSSYEPRFTTNDLFEVDGKTVFVVNSQVNSIDVYTIEKMVYTDDLYLKYQKSVVVPESFRMGTVYGIRCENKKCTVNTAQHMEGGCTFNFDPTKLSITLDECVGGAYAY